MVSQFKRRGMLCIISFMILSQLNSYHLIEAVPGESLIDNPQYSLISVLKRKTKIYTQGIIFRENPAANGETYLIESGGQYGQSTLTLMKYPSQNVVSQAKLNDKYFAEGIVQIGNFVYQLTWQNRKIIRYNLNNLKEQTELALDEKMREGWGLSDYKVDTLIATDGTDQIFFLNPTNFKVKSTLKVVYEGRPVYLLNEIRYVKENEALCNIYMSSRIARISLTDGKVIKMYDMSQIITYETSNQGNSQSNINSGECLNGIAIPNKNNPNRVILTGKLWSYFYEVELK